MIRIEPPALGTLMGLLRQQGFRVLGPVVRDQAIVIDELRSIEDLPFGWMDEQSNAFYGLTPNANKLFFGYSTGPHSWKQFLFPSSVTLVQSRRENGGGDFFSEQHLPPAPLAFFGMRPCDLQALAILDRVFLGGTFVDPLYKALRNRLFIVVVQCTRPGGTCFCSSLKTGPKAETGFDLALTEIPRDAGSHFLVEAGSQHGSEILTRIPWSEVREEEREEAEGLQAEAIRSMSRALDTDGLPQFLSENLSHPRWEMIGRRCLACANCTMVCPTCFCSTFSDGTDLSNTEAVRTRTWDSCFTADFSYIHGGSVRPSTRARFRQWMTHKLASWVYQFGTFGCVGCGRCITWCPVGIDITEEARLLRAEVPQASKI